MQSRIRGLDSPREQRVIGVAELDRRLKGALERCSGLDWVQGEVSGLRRAASGHVYFSLKDEAEDAVIDCVMYRTNAQRVRQRLVDGERVQVFGRATLWAPRGRLQFVADRLRAVGRGAILEALERLKTKLHAEGLFEPALKRALPSDPRWVGVITSGHGAAWKDIRTVTQRRTDTCLVFVPALVQGEGAVESLLQALDLIEQDTRIEVLIIGRGGGSADDLMAFNDERLVRRIAALRVPVVSAVGHEIDTSLCDLVADRRAATPSEAAELVAPDRQARRRELRMSTSRLLSSARRRLEEDRGVMLRLTTKLSDPRFLIAQKQQDMDELMLRGERAVRRCLSPSRQAASDLEKRLSAQHPRTVLVRERARLQPYPVRLRHAVDSQITTRAKRLEGLGAALQALSPLAILGRGYAVALDSEGRAVTHSEQVKPGDSIRLRLSRGILDTRVLSKEEES